MEVSWPAAGTVAAALAAGFGYLLKKYFDVWIENRRKIASARFDAVTRIEGMVAEIAHCVKHLRAGRTAYADTCRDWCMKVRQESRAQIALLGGELVEAVHATTDSALAILESADEPRYKQWLGLQSELTLRCQRLGVGLRGGLTTRWSRRRVS